MSLSDKARAPFGFEPLLLVSVVLSVLGIAALATVDGAIVFARWMVGAAVLICVWPAVRDRDGTLCVSPAFVLSAIVIVFFSIVPYVINVLVIEPRIASGAWVHLMKPWLPEFFGSAAEIIIVAFAAAGLLVHHLTTFAVPAFRAPQRVASAMLDKLAIVTVVGLAVALPAVTLATSFSGFVFSQLWTFYPPVQSLLLILLTHRHKTVNTLSPVSLALLYAAAVIPLAAFGQGKIPFLMLVAALGYYLSFGLPSAKRLLIFVSLVVAVFVVFIPISDSIRFSKFMEPDRVVVNRSFGSYMLRKIYVRQADTGSCLKAVIAQHGAEPFDLGRQFFWAEAMIPRALWPEKPNLSLGTYYSAKYCLTDPSEGNSASITLLGQPVIIGGMSGLALNGGLLLVLLGALTLTTRRSGGLGRIAITALLPWWIDFDQDFAMYVANLAKFALAMAPILIAVHITSRGQAPIG